MGLRSCGGYAPLLAILCLARRDLAELLTKILTERRCSFTATAKSEIVPEDHRKIALHWLGLRRRAALLHFPPQRGRLLGSSKRNCASFVWITTRSTHRLRKWTRRRLTCSQTVRSSLLAPNVSVALKWCSSQSSLVGIDGFSLQV